VTDKVVDASAIAAILFNEPRRAEVEAALAGAALCAPAFIDIEIASVCLKKLRLNIYPEPTVLAMYAAYDGIDIRRDAISLKDVIGVAQKTHLSLYDASYLWLARRLGVELVTLDQRLQKAAAKI
jgi:predicted nucleic acid-binding protein